MREGVAEALLALLKLRGVEYLFANSGTDFPSIIEGFARLRKAGRPHPRPVTVPHEFAAVSMAHGHSMVSGRPQAAMVHVNVGTANALSAVMNARRARVPMLLLAGRTPYTESGSAASRDIHSQWGQEMFDQAGMLRESVKWEYELRDPGQLESVVDRAFAIATSEPFGPVYISLPREVLAQEGQFSFGRPRQTRVAPLYPDPAAMRDAAEILAAAKAPLIITGHAGRDPRSVPLLSKLALRFALPVVEFRASALCLPDKHPMHLGTEAGPWVAEADAILVLDCDVPWIPAHGMPGPDCKVIEVAPDPLYRDYPLRGFPADLSVACGAAIFLRLLYDALEAALPHDTVAARRERISAQAEFRRAQSRERIERSLQPSSITQAFALACIDRLKTDEDLVVSEYPVLMNGDAMGFRQPGSYFGMSPAGALGWGLPAAVGAKLARPEARTLALVGDGAYMFSNPLACHQAAASLNLALATVVFNNRRWDATRRYTTRMYPDGVAVRERDFALSEFEPAPDYAMLCRSVGGHAERVESPHALPAALERMLKVLEDERRQCLLDVVCDG